MSLVERILGARVGEHVHAPIDRIVTDDWTTPALIEPLEAMGVARSQTPIVLVRDHTQHSVSYADPSDREKVERNEAIMHAFVDTYGAEPIDGGIQHFVLPERGYVRPGSVIVGNDSHTSTLGAYSVYAQAAQPTTIAAAMRSGHLPITVPETIGVELTGSLPQGVSARDAMLALLARLRDEDVTGRIIEYSGEGIAQLSMAERAVLANLAPEAGARSAIFPIDRVAQAYYRTHGIEAEQSGSSDLERMVSFSLADVVATIARSGSPSHGVSSDRFKRTRIDQVFVGTCAGGTYEEIAAFAQAVRGHELETRVIIAPVSRTVRDRLEDTFILDELRGLGATILEPGCGPCFGFGPGRLAEGEVGVSTGNRNAPGRMGRGSNVHLVSGRTAGIVARTGYLGESEEHTEPFERSVSITYPTSGNAIRIDGRITTDDITPSSVPGIGTSSDTDREVLRRLLFRYADEGFADHDLTARVLIAPDGFGYGSNRASSVRALMHTGIAGVVSPRIAPLYADGARDEGFAALVIRDDAFYRAITPESNVTIELAQGSVRVERDTFSVETSSYDRSVMLAGGIINQEVYS